MKYLTPEIEMIKFDDVDIIQTSSDPEGGNNGDNENNENQTPELDFWLIFFGNAGLKYLQKGRNAPSANILKTKKDVCFDKETYKSGNIQIKRNDNSLCNYVCCYMHTMCVGTYAGWQCTKGYCTGTSSGDIYHLEYYNAA